MKIAYSQLAEVDLMDFDFSSAEEELVDNYLRDRSTFKHNDSYEFILHLYLDESEEWFIKNELNPKLPDRMVRVILDARNKGASRICFYS